MNITIPDGASISIIVNAAGFDTPHVGALDDAPRILLSSAAPAPKASRRSGLLFAGAAGLMCVAVLSIVHFQKAPTALRVEPAHAERLSSQGVGFQPTTPSPAPLTRTTPAEQARADANAEATVRRLLAQAPRITPPPGAPVAPTAAPSVPAAGAPVAVLHPSTATAPAAITPPAAGKPNAFGMSD